MLIASVTAADVAQQDVRRGEGGFAAIPGPCPLCDFTTSTYLFTRQGAHVSRCANCGLVRVVGASPTSDQPPGTSSTERRTADGYVAVLQRHEVPRTGLLVVAADGHPFVQAAESQGYRVSTHVDVGDIERAELPHASHQSAVVLFQLERANDPVRVLERIRQALVPGGRLLIATPSLDSSSARFLRGQWAEWRPGNRCYFDLQTIQSVCLRSGFGEIEWTNPRAAASVMTITARRVDLPPRPLLSVVMPVFNERATFEETFSAVRDLDLPGIDKEIVIVESGSTDGTRELVRRYEGSPGVTVVLEDRPRGKGAAVRAGLARVTGTIVLIQDADNEYDVNDYAALLEPILTFRRAFVLGSRHMGSWKVRTFADQPAVSAFFNAGHVIFRTLFNVIYRQEIDDPFTMYKVFRRDCLHRLVFECNRFDFDFELVIKLVRKGYIPIEIPVNYRSRSFKDGKKVSAFRDPFTWIRALVKYRFAPIYRD